MLHKPAAAYSNSHSRISETKPCSRNKIVRALALPSCKQRLLRLSVFPVDLLCGGGFEVQFFPGGCGGGSKKPFLLRKGKIPFQRGQEERYEKQYCFQKIFLACTFHGAKVQKTVRAT